MNQIKHKTDFVNIIKQIFDHIDKSTKLLVSFVTPLGQISSGQLCRHTRFDPPLGGVVVEGDVVRREGVDVRVVDERDRGACSGRGITWGGE